VKGWIGLAAGLMLALAQTTAASAQIADFEKQQAEWDKVPDSQGDGPYPSVMEIVPSLGDYVVYRPADLSPLKPDHLGLFVWGNGACTDDGASARQHLSEIASYGYLVIAPGKWRSGPNAIEKRAPQRPPGTDGTIPKPPTTAADLRAALDWALDENERHGSRYFGMINENLVAVGGFSCGGLQALEIAGDERVRTVVIENSGIFNDGSQAIAGMTLKKDALKRLHTAVLYLLGGPTDIAYANGTDDFARIDPIPAVMVNVPTGHGGTYNEPNGGRNARIVVDWLEWQLRHDMKAARSFVGEGCGLCGDPNVELQIKNFR